MQSLIRKEKLKQIKTLDYVLIDHYLHSITYAFFVIYPEISEISYCTMEFRDVVSLRINLLKLFFIPLVLIFLLVIILFIMLLVMTFIM